VSRLSRLRIFTAFDWDWSDAFARESARSRALAARPDETAVLVAVVGADSILNFGIAQHLPAGHPVSELWLETQTDLLATIYLAYGGFFRQAFTVLRSWFELSVAGVYFSDHFEHRNSRYAQWRQGERQSPARMRDIACSLAARHANTLAIPEEVFFSKLDPLYGFLSRHAHGQGLDLFDLQDGRDNVPRFLMRSWDLWFSKALETFDVICFLHRAFFVDQLAAYLGAQDGERRRARRLVKQLASHAPDFAALVSTATQNVRA
jgi:hypothetical protein